MNTASQSASPRAPLALAAISIASGIVLSQHLYRAANLWGWSAGLLIACALVALFIHNARLARCAVVLALVCVGAFTRSATPRPSNPVLPAELLTGERVLITGHVTNDGSLLASGSRERFDLQSETIQLDDKHFDQPTGIRISVFVRGAAFVPATNQGSDDEENEADPAKKFQPLTYGQRVQLSAKLRPPRNFRNPGAFDYEGYLGSLGISALGSADADSIIVLSGQSGTMLGRWRSQIRHSMVPDWPERMMMESASAEPSAEMPRLPR